MNTPSYESAQISIQETDFELHPLKAMYWSKYRSLLIADTHLGKSVHFAEHCIRIPTRVEQDNFDRLFTLLQIYQPEKCIILGDLFHSILNESCTRFKRFCAAYPDVNWVLILGNHDILDLSFYQDMGLEIHQHLIIDSFLFSHHPLEDIPEGYYNLCGHIHPGVRIKGRGKQSLRLPCFYFSEHQGILPAFGAFTGLHVLDQKKADQVFAIAEEAVVRASSQP